MTIHNYIPRYPNEIMNSKLIQNITCTVPLKMFIFFLIIRFSNDCIVFNTGSCCKGTVIESHLLKRNKPHFRNNSSALEFQNDSRLSLYSYTFNLVHLVWNVLPFSFNATLWAPSIPAFVLCRPQINTKKRRWLRFQWNMYVFLLQL